MTQSPSDPSKPDLPKYPDPRDVERELKKARSQLHDAIWCEDEELKGALLRQIKRLEFLKEMGERYDVDY